MDEHHAIAVRQLLAGVFLSLGLASGVIHAEEFATQIDGIVVGDDAVPAPAHAPDTVSLPEWVDSEAVGESAAPATGVEFGDAEHGTAAGEFIPAAAAVPLRPRWNLAVDALMLWQGNAQSLPLLINDDGATVINAQDLQTDMSGGVRIGLIRAMSERYSIEGNYFQARPFTASGAAPATGGPYTLVNMGDLVFNDVESATVSTNGWIKSAELNWRKNECYSPITWLAGFRWVELNSQANVDTLFANTDPDAYGSGEVSTNVGNNLYGGQMGADVRLWNARGRWRANAVGKAGVFLNSVAYQRSTAGFIKNTGEPFPFGTVAATADQTSFFGEVGLNSTYWVTNWLAWRAGYVVMWASGVAVAPEQLPLNSFGDGTASINTDSSVLLHGVTTGIEARW
jgi:hypothetical protein